MRGGDVEGAASVGKRRRMAPIWYAALVRPCWALRTFDVIPISRLGRAGGVAAEFILEAPESVPVCATSPVSSEVAAWKPLAARSLSKPDPAKGWPPMADIAETWPDAG
jgi:hypothetical protein